MIELLGLKFKKVKNTSIFKRIIFRCTEDKDFEISIDIYNYLTIEYGYYKHESSIFIFISKIPNFNYKCHKECQKVINNNIAEICKQLILHRSKYPIKIFNKINYNLDAYTVLL